VVPACAAPANDDLAGAEGLGSGENVSTFGNNVTATKEPAEANHAGNAGGHSLWFAWTAPKNMGVTITVCAQNFDTLLAVYTGSSYPLTQVASNDDNQDTCELRSSVTFMATVGITYKVAVDGKDGVTGDFSLHIRRTPLNDDLAAAEPFSSSLPWWHEGNELGTKEPGEPDHAGNAGGHSVWFKWTAPSNGRFSFDTGSYSGPDCSSEIDTLLGVYTGVSYPLTEIASDDDGSPCGHGASRVLIDAVEGTVYKIAVDGKDGESGQLWLQVRGQPANDELADATPLQSVSFVTARVFNEFATKELGEPSHAGDPGGHSLWYSWIAPADGEVAVNTCYSGVDTLLAVYTGSSYPLTEVASNDDGGDCGGGTSRLTFSAVAGVAYKIAVDAKDGEDGPYSLALRTRPPNDDLAAPAPIVLPLVGDSTMTFFSNTMATVEPDEPSHAGGTGGHSVWFSWTAPTSRPASFSTGEYSNGGCYGGIDTLLAVYTGSSYPLTEVASNDDGGDCGGGASKVVFDAVAGTMYKIVVDGKAGAQGDVALALSRLPIYDAFASPKNLELAAPVSNELATKEPGEPNHAGNSGGHSLWYSFAPAIPRRYAIETCNSDFDTLLAVYRGNAFPVVEVGSNDDGCGQQSRLLLASKAGAVYRIAIDGKDGASGLVSPSLQLATEELETFVDSGPSGPTKDLQPSFEFHSNFLDTDFRCRVDTQPYGPCLGSYAPSAPLAPGPHTFEVKAVIEGGDEDLSPALRSFVVAAPPHAVATETDSQQAAVSEAVPPQVTLTRKPKALVLIKGKRARVRFEFTSSVPGATFLCKLDRDAYAPCDSPAKVAVRPGKHDFSVLAVGPGNSPASARAHCAFRVQKRR